eukprot:TRINITY_DN6623_c0_g1_i1.p1 TRINITY_DN6623_c0_g1~~TRINITY_DN6623_c0_g1_i1.p1  ORF type:complete len:793 (+),score=187.00 TRINITY_DN6623_c0_g1_i1:55-2379(+)
MSSDEEVASSPRAQPQSPELYAHMQTDRDAARSPKSMATQGVSQISIRGMNSRPSYLLAVDSVGSESDIQPVRKRKKSQKDPDKQDSQGSLYELANDFPQAPTVPSGVKAEDDEVEVALKKKASLRSGFCGAADQNSKGAISDEKMSTVNVRGWIENSESHGISLVVALLPLLIALCGLLGAFLAYGAKRTTDSDSHSKMADALANVCQQQWSVNTLVRDYTLDATTPDTDFVESIAAAITQLTMQHEELVPWARHGGLDVPLTENLQRINSAASGYPTEQSALRLLDGAIERRELLVNLTRRSLHRLSKTFKGLGSRSGVVATDVAQVATMINGMLALRCSAAFQQLADFSTDPSVSDEASRFSFREFKLWEMERDLDLGLGEGDAGGFMLHLDLLDAVHAAEILPTLEPHMLRMQEGLRVVSGRVSDPNQSEGVVVLVCVSLTIVIVLVLTVCGTRVLLSSLREQKEQQLLDIQERRCIEESVAHFVPAEFLTLLNYEHVTQVRIGDRVQTEITMIFTDLRSFTTFSTTMTSLETFRWLNKFFGRMNPVIRQFDGFVDKYMGDGIMALFREPSKAVAASISMQHALTDFNAHRRATDPSAWYVRMGIGIHHGDVVAGTIGNKDRLSTTIVSENVILCSKIESLTKTYGCNILISETVRALVDLGDVPIRRVGRISARCAGYHAIDLFDVFEGDADEDRLFKIRTSTQFERAMAAYTRKDWAVAAELFEQLEKDAIAQKFPEGALDTSYRYKRELCCKYREEGTPPDWSGEDG